MQTRGRIDAERIRQELGAAAADARDAIALVDDLVDALAERVEGGAFVRRLEPTGLVLLSERGFTVAVGTLPPGRGIAGRALRQGKLEVVNDLAADRDAIVPRAGATGAVVLPLAIGEERLVLGIELDDAPGPEDVALVRVTGEVLVARYAALSPRARTLDPTRTMTRAFARLSGQRGSGRLLELVARVVGETLGAAAAATFVLGEDERPELRALWRRDLTAPDAIAPPASVPTTMDGPVIGPRRALVPLRAGESLLGVVVAEAATRDAFADADIERAELLAMHAATSHANLRQYESAVALALTDGLTGLPNHRRFHEDGRALVEASASDGDPFALVAVDIDDFKDLNDRRGHVAGDDALRLVGRVLSAGVRPDDRAYRTGGEEFHLLLPDTTRSNARTVCRRLQRQLANVDIDGWRLTASIGIAAFPEDGDSLDDLVAGADAALHEAKRLGKDRITFADERLVARRSHGATMDARGRRSFEQMRQLQTLAAAVGRARSEEEVGVAALGHLKATLNFSAARIYATGADDRFRTLAAVGGHELAEAAEGALVELATRVRDESRSFLVDELQRPELKLADGSTLRSAIVAPMIAEDVTVGAIMAVSTSASRFDRDDQRLLDVIGALVGLAFENARLLGRSVVAANVAAGMLDALADLARAASGRAVGEAALAGARSLVGGDAAWWRGPDGLELAADGSGVHAWEDAPSTPPGLPARPLGARVLDGAALGVDGRLAVASVAGDVDGLLAVRLPDGIGPEALEALGRLAFHAGVVATSRR